MIKKIKLLKLILFFVIFFNTYSFSQIINNIIINGNERIPNETILMFSTAKINENIDSNRMNEILKNLYDSNFFKDVSVKIDNEILYINVDENPIIQEIIYKGIKSNRIKEAIKENLILKPRSSYNEISLKNDKENVKSALKKLGYYFSEIEIYVENLQDNKVNITFDIDIGDKAKIKKISFIGNKIFKERKLKSLIVSEEYKFWKFISGKKYLNEDLISLDKRLLKNYYLNKGFFNVEINSSFARLVDNENFELIYNINANKKFFFDNLSIKLPNDFDQQNFDRLKKLFSDLKGEPYSLNRVKNILEEIDLIALEDQYLSVNASVEEKIVSDKINLTFTIDVSQQSIVEKINIFGNNVTRENVIRNQLEIDEGDYYNEILANKSINNLKSLNFFKTVKSEVLDGSDINQKIINISVEEKPTGEISAGAGVGTNGGTVSFGIRENNYLGKGLTVQSNLTINEESLKGLFSVSNPNYKNSDKAVYFTAEATETDRLKNFGYKTNKNGFTIGTNFEYLRNFRIGVGNSHYYEKIDTDSTASTRQQAQEGNYWDSFLNFRLDYDTRNQKFQTSDGIRSRYFLDLPLLSETASLTNSFDFKSYAELYENNVSTFSFFLSATTSIKDENIKLSERIFLPSNKLRGFERGKIGPKDGDDFIGGNYAMALNFSSTIPKILENSQDIDVLVFLDAANVWGVDYFDGNDEGSELRSALGIGVDWLTPIGPLSFTLAEPLSKANTDKTESFRFNLGTTF